MGVAPDTFLVKLQLRQTYPNTFTHHCHAPPGQDLQQISETPGGRGQAMKLHRGEMLLQLMTHYHSQRPYLKPATHHPPTHKSLSDAHGEQQAQPPAQRAIHPAPVHKVGGWHSKHQAKRSAPHAMRILHPEDEFELLQAHSTACRHASQYLYAAVQEFCMVQGIIHTRVGQELQYGQWGA